MNHACLDFVLVDTFFTMNEPIFISADRHFWYINSRGLCIVDPGEDGVIVNQYLRNDENLHRIPTDSIRG